MTTAIISFQWEKPTEMQDTSAIFSSTFAIGAVKEDIYELSIQFFDNINKSGDPVSTKTFTFCPLKSKKESKIALEENPERIQKELLDVHTQNGYCRSKQLVKKMVGKSDRENLEHAQKLKKEWGLKARTLMVLDLQDERQGYRESTRSTIAKCEKFVCDFLKSKKSKKSDSAGAKALLSLALDYVLCEGSLKVDILQAGDFSKLKWGISTIAHLVARKICAKLQNFL